MWLLQHLYSTEGKTSVEIRIRSKIRALAVLPHEIPRIVSGEGDTVQLRNLANATTGKRIESDTDVLAVAASMDGRWFVTGTTDGFTIWKMEPSGGAPVRVSHHAISGVRTIDISPDSKWVATGSDAPTVDVWDVSTGEMRQVLGLKHEHNVVAVKFCPCGKRIATATLFGSIRIYATTSGKKLLTIPVSVTSTLSARNITLAWFPKHPHIFAVSQGQIKCLNSENGSVVFQWATRCVTNPSSVALSPNSKFIAYSVNRMVVIRDTVTHQQIGDTLQHGGNVSCLVFSPGSDRLIVGADTKFTIWDLGKLFKDAAYVPDSAICCAGSCILHDQDITIQKPISSTFSLPLMCISNAAVKPWLHGFLKPVEEVLSAEIDSPASPPNHDTLANRALVRGRLGHGSDEVLKDAEQSLSIQESAIGHIAKAKALVLQKKEDLAKQEIRILDVFQSNTGKPEDTFLVKIIQSILHCLSGEETTHIKLSIDRKDQDQTKLLSLVQANMHLSEKHFDLAMESFENAHVPTIFPHEESPEMWSLSFIFGWKFSGLGIQIQQEKCQSLLNDDSPEAAYLFLDISKIYHREIVLHVKLSHWSADFKKRCLERLEGLGNKALDSHDYKKAIEQYTAVKPLMEDSESKHALLLKRSRAHLELGREHPELGPENWDCALRDAEEAIGLNTLSPWGHERKHAVLYEVREYHEAAEALNQMVECLADSMDDESKELRKSGVEPRTTKFNIDKNIDDIFAPDQPRPIVLVNTKSGRLCDKPKQAEAFKADPEYKKLILSPASQLKDDVVKRILSEYFRYSTFSHTWEVDGDSEPQFGDVGDTSVDRLKESVPNTKLQTFCKKTLDHGYLWAWSDTCCINQDDEKVLNVSLRSMYQWYFHSSLTLVHLKGVFRQLGDTGTVLDEFLQEFVDCRWNKRAWTLQEYFASRVIQFYTEDWKPYLPIRHCSATDPVNHKLYPPIQRGMYLVTGVDPHRLAALKAGDDDRDARQKLSLASTRKAAKEEDIAYSLLGIFDVTIETIYGGEEVHRALGRLLGALLTKYADVTILAWTGKTSKYNTCLPAEIAVYHDPDCHVPQLTSIQTIPNTRSSIPPTELESAVKLHNHLVYSSPQLHHGRLHLPCIQFALKLADRDSTSRIFTVTSPLLVDKVQITTTNNVSSRHMVLVHPWFRRLLDAPITMSDSAQALRFLAALKQRFGALLLAWNSTSSAYERIAADQFIEVQIRDDVSPGELLANFTVLQIR